MQEPTTQHSAWDCPQGTGPERWTCTDRVCRECRMPHGDHHFMCSLHSSHQDGPEPEQDARLEEEPQAQAGAPLHTQPAAHAALGLVQWLDVYRGGALWQVAQKAPTVALAAKGLHSLGGTCGHSGMQGLVWRATGTPLGLLLAEVAGTGRMLVRWSAVAQVARNDNPRAAAMELARTTLAKGQQEEDGMAKTQDTLQPGTQVWVQFDGSTRGRNMRYLEHSGSTVVLATRATDMDGKRYPLRSIVAATPPQLKALAEQARVTHQAVQAKLATRRAAEQAAAAISATTQVPPQDAAAAARKVVEDAIRSTLAGAPDAPRKRAAARKVAEAPAPLGSLDNPLPEDRAMLDGIEAARLEAVAAASGTVERLQAEAQERELQRRELRARKAQERADRLAKDQRALDAADRAGKAARAAHVKAGEEAARPVDATARHAVLAQDVDGMRHLAVWGLEGGAAYVAACQPTDLVLRADTAARYSYKTQVARMCQACRTEYAAALDAQGLPWYTRAEEEPDPHTVGLLVIRQGRLLAKSAAAA